MRKPMLGRIILEITCADCTDLLNRLQMAQICVRDITYLTGVNLRITVSGHEYHRVCSLVEKRGGSVKVKRISKIHRAVNGIKNHPAVLFVVLSLLMATLWIPKRVLFISVDGNVSVPANRILEAARECGLHFGIARQSVRSEVIKNALLQEIPQLQWAGVNTRGCTAIISIKEKTVQEKDENTDNQVCSIVALRDGIIQSCTVYQGNQLCTSGQAVKAGQTLVSGYMDCGAMIKATRADAEITALTFRDLEIITPIATTIRRQEASKEVKYSLQIGKKRINLSKDSGNLNASCGKIYVEKPLRLPGGFVVPISLIQETVIIYDVASELPSVAEDERWLEDFSKAYLKSTMIAGDVVSAETKLIQEDGYSCLYGRFACIEMIGRVKYEQMLLKG